MTYLQRYGSTKSPQISIPTEYHLTLSANPSVYRAPTTNEPYSKVSGDFNPIHTNPYFSLYELPGTITHGMFSSAAARCYVETVVTLGIPDRVYKIKYTAMHDGNFVTTINQHVEWRSRPLSMHLLAKNPKTKTIHFGGIKGQPIREQYMEMTYDTTDRGGNIRTLLLLADINVRTLQHTFIHPNGYALESFVQPDAAFADHSLGEFSALASVADILPNSSLVDVVFYRGLTMQRAVERDELSRSNCAMCATFDDAALREVVDTISNVRDCLLEIVNFNVEGQQYVCAGELVALKTLTNVLNYLKVQKVDITKAFKDMLKDIVNNCYDHALEKQKSEGYIVLECGLATIPLAGIDIPFHSRYLWSG
ncbi:acyl transferase domain-containing protein, partial [Lactifluus volemus]